MNTTTETERYTLHTFKMNETIHMVIKLINGHQLHEAELICLVKLFNELNDNKVPKPGQSFKIPIWTLGTCLYKETNTPNYGNSKC